MPFLPKNGIFFRGYLCSVIAQNIKKSMKNQLIRTAVAGGLLTAIGCALLLWGLYAMGLNPFGRHKFMYMPVYAAGLSFSMLFFRAKYNGGSLQAWQGILIGLIANAVGATFYSALAYTMLRFSDALLRHRAALLEWIEQRKGELTAQFGNDGLKDLIARTQDISAASIATDEMIKTSLIGVVMAMALALVFKQQRKN
jgi:hypothetical protein